MTSYPIVAMGCGKDLILKELDEIAGLSLARWSISKLRKVYVGEEVQLGYLKVVRNTTRNTTKKVDCQKHL